VTARDNYANYAIIISTIIFTFFYVRSTHNACGNFALVQRAPCNVQHAAWNLYKFIGAIKSLIQ